MASNTERSRRLRAHRKDDHSLCLATSCDAGNATAVASATVAVAPPVGLGARGTAMWSDLVTASTGPAERVLIAEACRIADRLERLDRQLRGADREWLRLTWRETEGDLIVTVDKALSEARQQAVALKQLLGEIRQAQAPAKSAPARTAAPGPTAPPEVPSGVADLTGRIRRRSG